MTNYSTLILMAIIFAVVGISAVALVIVLVNNRSRAKLPEEKIPQAAPPTPNKVLELQRDPSSGRLLVEIDGQLLTSAQSLSEEQRARMQKTARELVEWLGLIPAQNAPRPATAAPQPATSSAMPSAKPGGFRATMERTASAPARPPEPGAVIPEEPVQPVPATLFPTAAKKVEPVRPPTSIVEQIDQVLQEQINGTPVASKAVRLTDGGNQGVIVWVGVQRYVGIDAVPDAEIQSAIRAAVAEWEKRSESGPRA